MSILKAVPRGNREGTFFFETEEQFLNHITGRVHTITWVAGDDIDKALFEAVQPGVRDIARYFEWEYEWSEYDKYKYIIAVDECGYMYDDDIDPDDICVDIYPLDNMKELAYEFVDEGLFGEIPANLLGYISYEAIARDLSFDYHETEIAGEHMIYRAD